MNLHLLRHASAGTRRPNPLLDIKRPLDKEGKQHCLQLAYVLNALKINFDVVVSSPLHRSLQTAQLVATETGYEQPILISRALSPEGSYTDFQHLLSEHRDSENLLMVGHCPNIQQFLGCLLIPPPSGGPDQEAYGAAHSGSAQPAQVRLRKGSFARLSMSRGPANLQSLLDPRTVRALYSTSTKSSRRKTSRK